MSDFQNVLFSRRVLVIAQLGEASTLPRESNTFIDVSAALERAQVEPEMESRAHCSGRLGRLGGFLLTFLIDERHVPNQFLEPGGSCH